MLRNRLLPLFFALTVTFSSFAQDLRIEPMNWWAGMKNPNLQLMVYGDKIGETTPVIKYPGVTIRKVNKAKSNNYLFIDLSISSSAKPGNFPIRFMRNGQQAQEYTYSLLARTGIAAREKGFSSSDVIYLITPDRFANGDTTNDIVTGMREMKIDRKAPFGRHGGDIRGIIDHLDYIASMGFTAIWPTPMLENDMRQGSYHGYAITDFYKVDPRFGTLDDYKELAIKARKKGLKLIFDGVINHSGSEYWWMKDLPFDDWINYKDSIRITNHRRTVHQDPYAADDEKELMVKGWFVRSMPDLNQQNTYLGTYLIQNSIWWIETLGLAGIRQDTYPYSPKPFLEKWTCQIMNEYPAFSIVGEEWTTNQDIVAYWQKGKPNTSGYNGCLRSTMDFPMQSLLVQSLNDPEEGDKGLIRLYEGLANDFVYANPNDLLIFGDNHDMDRVFMQLNQDPELVQMALTWLLTSRGIPQIYYGTEVLLDNTGHHKNDGLIRADFPGGWSGDASDGFNGTNLAPDQQRTREYLKMLLNWRKANPVIHQGKTLHFTPQKGVYVYFRYNAKDIVMVVMNKNKEEVMLDTARFHQALGTRSTAVDPFAKTSQPLSAPLKIPARAATIFEIR